VGPIPPNIRSTLPISPVSVAVPLPPTANVDALAVSLSPDGAVPVLVSDVPVAGVTPAGEVAVPIIDALLEGVAPGPLTAAQLSPIHSVPAAVTSVPVVPPKSVNSSGEWLLP